MWDSNLKRHPKAYSSFNQNRSKYYIRDPLGFEPGALLSVKNSIMPMKMPQRLHMLTSRGKCIVYYAIKVYQTLFKGDYSHCCCWSWSILSQEEIVGFSPQPFWPKTPPPPIAILKTFGNSNKIKFYYESKYDNFQIWLILVNYCQYFLVIFPSHHEKRNNCP